MPKTVITRPTYRNIQKPLHSRIIIIYGFLTWDFERGLDIVSSFTGTMKSK